MEVQTEKILQQYFDLCYWKYHPWFYHFSGLHSTVLLERIFYQDCYTKIIRVILQCIRTIWTVRRSEFDGPDPMQYADVTCIISDPEGHFREKKYFELIWFSLPNISRVFSVRISGLFSVRYLSRSLGFIPRRRYGFNPRWQDLATHRGPSLPRCR